MERQHQNTNLARLPGDIKDNTSRSRQALERRAEERVLCAILHASSPFGLLALVSSGIVWVVHRKQSRFVAVQSLQAVLFQLSAALAFFLVFGLFSVGFLYAAFSGLIAQTGVTNPELTTFLLIAMLTGFACILLVWWVYPLGGVWAALQLLRGRTYLYPLLGRWVVNWIARQPITAQATPLQSGRSADVTNAEAVLAGITHVSVLGGFGAILGPIIWASSRNPSRFLTEHVFQASVFQLLMASLTFGTFVSIWGLTAILGLFGAYLPSILRDGVTAIIDSPVFFFGWMSLLGGLFLSTGILAIIAALAAFRGRMFRYPIVGGWLARYLYHV